MRRDSYSEMSTSGIPSHYDPVEWLRLSDSIEADHNEIQKEMDMSNIRTLSVRQKRNISKKLVEVKENLAKLDKAIYKWEENPMKFKM